MTNLFINLLMSLIVDYSKSDRILVCHTKQWHLGDNFSCNGLALKNVIDGRYRSVSLVYLADNSEEIYQQLKGSIDRGDSILCTFNVYGGRVANDFVAISKNQLLDWVPDFSNAIENIPD